MATTTRRRRTAGNGATGVRGAPALPGQSGGIPAFFVPNPVAWLSSHTPLGIERAGYYSTLPLRETLCELIDLDHLAARHVRLTVGAVNARNDEMRYFDSRDEALRLDHVLASGALPPAFPAIRIDGDPYWDGGIYSNTPIEAVLDDKPRRDSLIFAVQMWNPEGPEPETLWQVMGRQKDIQYASRAASHIARQKQIHHLRHIIREMAKHVPDSSRDSAAVKELAAWGCGTTMHVSRLVAPKLDGDDHTKDIDFTPAGIRARWQAGYADTRAMLERAPWTQPVDPIDGVVIHDPVARPAIALARGPSAGGRCWAVRFWGSVRTSIARASSARSPASGGLRRDERGDRRRAVARARRHENAGAHARLTGCGTRPAPNSTHCFQESA